LQSLQEQKAERDKQQEMELSALSQNLAAVRQQLEGSKVKVKELEGAMREKASKMQGNHIA